MLQLEHKLVNKIALVIQKLAFYCQFRDIKSANFAPATIRMEVAISAEY